MSWQMVEGHDEVVETFRQALRRGRLAHAYLFTGPPGIGKRLFADRLARSLLCEDRAEEELDFCDRCPGCTQVRAGTHPDLILVSRAADEHELPIETVRRAIRDLGFKPDRGGRKIAIVDDADQMNQYAANCFLKSLEEPPPHSLLILIGTHPDRQLPTIRSRCQVVRFRPLSANTLAGLLLRRGLVRGRPEAERLAQMSHGSMERACGFADPELGQFYRELGQFLAGTEGDSVGLAERMSALIDAAGKGSAEKRFRAKLLIGLATEFLHSCLRASVGLDVSSVTSKDRSAVEQVTTGRSPEAIARMIERSMEADYQIDRKASLPLVVQAWADHVAR